MTEIHTTDKRTGPVKVIKVANTGLGRYKDEKNHSPIRKTLKKGRPPAYSPPGK